MTQPEREVVERSSSAVAAVAIVVLVIIAGLAVLAFGALNWLRINPGGGADEGTGATDQPGVLPTLPAPAPTMAPPESFYQPGSAGAGWG